MFLTSFFVFVPASFMTLLSVSYFAEVKKDTRFTKKHILSWIRPTFFAFCMNLCVCILSYGMWTGNWHLLSNFSEEALSSISYQKLFDLSLALLTMYAGSFLIGHFLRTFPRSSQAGPKSRNPICLLLSCSLLLLASAFLFIGLQGERHILISEFYLSDKNTTLHGLDTYIELLNDGTLYYDTDGLYLSDDETNLQKMQVNKSTISPNGTMLIQLDDNLFSFGHRGGDMLLLSDSRGSILDKVIVGDARQDKSYTRTYQDRSWRYSNPSPGAYNPETPQFSVAPGFYNEAFSVELYTRDHADIYYTLDGSTPTVESEKYRGSIPVYDRSAEENRFRSIENVTRNWMEKTPDNTPVPKATVIRAIAVNSDGAASEIVTATYFVNLDTFRDSYLVSLVADPEDLFGPQGIYSTGEDYDQWYLNGQLGEEPLPNYEIHGLECSGNFELFHVTSQNYLNQACGIRIQGGSHRNGRMKRLSVFSREEYSGSKFFDQSIFGDWQNHSVALREGFSNAFTMELVPQRSLATQSSIPVSVFLNGEYWYETYLQEKYSDEYFEERYHLEDVEFFKSGVTYEMQSFVKKNDLQTEDAYRQLNEIVDIQSYIDFMCTNIYLANTDYSESAEGGNAAIWRSRKIENDSYGDGRWRWALYDMDLITAYCREEMGLIDITDAQLNSFSVTRAWTIPLDERPFYSALKKNPQFRQQFVLTFMDMANTCFAPDFVEDVLNRWGEDLSYQESFFLNRKAYITEYLADSYDLSGTQECLSVEISNPAAGTVQVNTCTPDLTAGVWNGTYYTDYPVTLTAQAHNGYRFVRWEGDVCSESSVISFVLPEGGVSVLAVYEPYEK